MRTAPKRTFAGFVCFVIAALSACSHDHESRSWNQKAAASYLDKREAWWATWSVSGRDHSTFCVSCHTALPYALSRPRLRAVSGQSLPTDDERALLNNVAFRVRHWSEVQPYYVNKEAQSRGTESVLNALILASYDSQVGKLSDDTRAAFDHMWALQQNTGVNKGAWNWLEFNDQPWEAPDSTYYGAGLAAIAVGTAPENYSANPGIQNNLQLLREYLQRESASQSPINRVVLLWASAKLPGLLTPERQQSIINEIVVKQQPDGGWCLSTLVGPWSRHDGTSLNMQSDGYATGLITYAFQQVGISQRDDHLARGLAWLANNQSGWNGHWPAYSLNIQRRNPFSYISRFMDDAATGYAVLALTEGSSNASVTAKRNAGPTACVDGASPNRGKDCR
jgi:squalene-hopene/tetraprenyl-beta-curcumene cyclase